MTASNNVMATAAMTSYTSQAMRRMVPSFVRPA